MAWKEWLAWETAGEDERFEEIRRATLTGRPCGTDDFVADLERRLGNKLTREKPGPKPRLIPDDENQLELL